MFRKSYVGEVASQPAVFSYTVCSSLVALLCAVDFSIINLQ